MTFLIHVVDVADASWLIDCNPFRMIDPFVPFLKGTLTMEQSDFLREHGVQIHAVH